MNTSRINELMHKREEDEKKRNCILWVLAIIGAVAAVAGIAYAVYRFFTPDYLEDFEDDFDDDFDDDFFEDEEPERKPADKAGRKRRGSGSIIILQTARNSREQKAKSSWIRFRLYFQTDIGSNVVNVIEKRRYLRGNCRDN